MWTSSHFLNDNNSIFAKQLKTLFMKKTLKSLNGKKLSSKDMVSLKGGKLAYVKTMVLTNRSGQVSDDGNMDDSSWASGSDL